MKPQDLIRSFNLTGLDPTYVANIEKINYELNQASKDADLLDIVYLSEEHI